MHKEDIKAVIRKKFGTLTRFEERRALPHGSTKDVLRGRSIARTEAAIAEELNKPVQKLFPNRYGPAPSTKVDNSATEPATHRLTTEAR